MYRGNIAADYGSHIPILAAAVAATRGPVVELGAGDNSTPMLHYMCRAMRRGLVTFDNDPKWMTRFSEYNNQDWHMVCGVCPPWHMEIENPACWYPSVNSARWGLAFVDCAPGEIRTPLIRRLKDRADLIVVHDSEKDHGSGADYKYEQVIPEFRYVSEFRRFRPYTLVLSNVMDFKIEEVDQLWIPPGK